MSGLPTQELVRSPKEHLPADACAPDGNCDLTFFETLAVLDLLQARACLIYPKVMAGVCEDANVGFCDFG